MTRICVVQSLVSIFSTAADGSLCMSLSILSAVAVFTAGIIAVFTGGIVAVLAAGVVTVFAAGSARADLPPLIPREVLFGNPERMDPRISPDGYRMAYLRPDSKNVLQVWVRTAGKDDDRPVTQDPKRGIYEYGWAWNGREIYYLQDNDGDENYHFNVTDLDSSRTRDLTPFAGVQANVLALEPDHPDEVILTLNRRDPSLFEPWKCDLKTGELTLLAENPGNVRLWLADTHLVVRGQVAGRPDGGGEFRVRDDESSPWRTVISWGVEDQFEPIGFSRTDRAVFVQTDVGADTKAVDLLDLDTGKLRLLADYPGADAERILLSRKTHAVQAVSFNRLRPTWRVLDPTVKRDLEGLSQLGPGDFDVISRDQADLNWTIAYYGDTGGTKYFVWNRPSQKAFHLFDALPKLSSYQLAPMKAFEIKSRDGLAMPSYLTLPVGVDPKHLPLVLYVHGGPWARDYWGFEPTVQWLANRGYAVLQINYRGSAGFGRTYLRAARKQFAGKMHDDLIDGVEWAVREGIADRKRIGIMGASYGGYATLVGLSFTPDVFACGVDMVGPSNLVTLVESFPPYWKPFLSARWYPLVGDPSNPEDRKDMLARSPISRVDRIKAPLLVGQGANDPRVKKEESDSIVAALKGRGVPVDYIVFPDEGHGFARPENRLTFSTAAEAFLARYLGGRAEPGAKM